MNETTTYSIGDLTRLFKRSPSAIRNWTEEFRAYLSPSANPSAKQHRRYTEEDLGVLALVAEMKDAGQTFDDIHATLAAGQRGIAPLLDEVDAGSPDDLRLALSRYQQTVLALQQQLETALAASRPLEDEIVRLRAQLEMQQRQNAELQQMYKDAMREAGKSYHAGYMDALQSSKSDDD